ncbi:hypothetical protein E2C01_064467 [Portunus trituberculatus]|uniref:Uncharacterized protein n=1 Tax=Portunus trituberculatus TaxID=210409 RepID=A0A5B7HKX4_PORTR|nr:hypothetical protein [Portunus trituberculatus]
MNDTETITVSLSARREDTILNSCQALMCKSKEKIREVTMVTGLLVAATPASRTQSCDTHGSWHAYSLGDLMTMRCFCNRCRHLACFLEAGHS